jgi:ArsR family metal-binding transcriptional regulator
MPPLTRLYRITMANTGTEVTRTVTGNMILIKTTRPLFCLNPESVARMSEVGNIFKLAAPVMPTSKYTRTQVIMEYQMTLRIGILGSSSFTKDGMVVI